MSDDLRKLIMAVESGDRPDWREYLNALPAGILNANGLYMTYAAAASSAWHGSADAAIALCEALLPGWGWGKVDDLIFVTNKEIFLSESIAPLARALLLAVLRAKLMEAENE